MDELFKSGKGEKRSRKNLLIATIAAVALIGAIIFLIAQRPSMEDQTAAIMNGALREGSPEFDAINKQIIISTDESTVESPTGLGTISMYIRGNVKNRSDQTITLLEVNAAVVSTTNQVLKQKRVLVVPTQAVSLGPGETIPLTLALEGFDRKDDRADIRWKVTAIKLADK
ncbi:MAG: hypothetical protein HS105_08990 [Chloracidobacterium sp.]|nr:hypothetical protein [Chloracidobacterium sp.]MCO5334323.1 hypothetical protein [Pyrinomonadaceae bacterium]